MNSQDIFQKVVELDAIKDILLFDIHAPKDLLTPESSLELQQHVARSMIRNAFSAVDGILFATKKITLEIDNSTKVFDPNTRLKLAEKKLRKGSAQGAEEPLHLSVKDNVKFTFDSLTKSCDGKFSIDSSSPKWEIFLSALEIRHRLTHPKSLTSLTISAKEYQVVFDSVQWLFNEHGKLMDDANRSLRENSRSD